uniref:N-lysine methyltransferase setd6-like n=1 Tax=Rhizophora mucronata TaxID=61149 RepID=A0A2P2QZM8_RHIMU
MLSIAWMWKP